MRKPTCCICENKDADQLGNNFTAVGAYVFGTSIVQPLFFLNQKPSPVAVQSGLGQTWLETPETSFLTTGLI